MQASLCLALYKKTFYKLMIKLPNTCICIGESFHLNNVGKFSLFYRDIYFCRLEEISGAASKEYSLEKAMEKMKLEWKDMMFEFVPYRDTVSNHYLS